MAVTARQLASGSPVGVVSAGTGAEYNDEHYAAGPTSSSATLESSRVFSVRAFEIAMQRGGGQRPRSPLPLPLVGGASHLHELALRLSLSDFCHRCREERYEEDAWLVCCVSAVNGLAGKSRAAHVGSGTKMQLRALEQMKSCVKRVLTGDCRNEGSPEEAEKELAN